MRIELLPDHLLDVEVRRRIDELSDTVYPPDAALGWAAAKIQWAPQTIRAMVWDDGRLLCHVGALVRSAVIDGRAVRVGGIGRVMTAAEARRQGHARAALAAMRRHLVVDRQVDFSLLFCPAELYAFYAQLGWRLFAGRALVEQPCGTVAFTLNRAMVQNGREPAPPGRVLDLRGPPW